MGQAHAFKERIAAHKVTHGARGRATVIAGVVTTHGHPNPDDLRVAVAGGVVSELFGCPMSYGDIQVDVPGDGSPISGPVRVQDLPPLPMGPRLIRATVDFESNGAWVLRRFRNVRVLRIPEQAAGAQEYVGGQEVVLSCYKGCQTMSEVFDRYGQTVETVPAG